jgi:small subunit ribosomal protein S4
MRTGPKYKICRRVGDKVFGKCQTTKFSISGSDKNNKRPKAVSEYGAQLLEKQKAKYTYGVAERQFANYVKRARSVAGASPVDQLFKLLETRLDNVIFQMGIVPSRTFARQVVSHGHILVNGRRITIPSYQVRPGDKISIRPQSGGKGIFRDLIERTKEHRVPEWLIFDPNTKQGEVKALPPLRKDSETTLNFNSIIEFYSRV